MSYNYSIKQCGQIIHEYLQNILTKNELKRIAGEVENGTEDLITFEELIMILFNSCYFRENLCNMVMGAINAEKWNEARKIYIKFKESIAKSMDIKNLLNDQEFKLLENFLKPILQVNDIKNRDIEFLKNHLCKIFQIQSFNNLDDRQKEEFNKIFDLNVLAAKRRYYECGFPPYDISYKSIYDNIINHNFIYMLMDRFLIYCKDLEYEKKENFDIRTIKNFMIFKDRKNNDRGFNTSFLTNNIINELIGNHQSIDNCRANYEKYNRISEPRFSDPDAALYESIENDIACECMEVLLNEYKKYLFNFYDYLGIILNVSRLLCEYVQKGDLNNVQMIKLPANDDLGALKAVWDNTNNFLSDAELNEFYKSQLEHEPRNPGLPLRRKYNNGKYICQDCGETHPCGLSLNMVILAKEKNKNIVKKMTRVFYDTENPHTCSAILIKIFNKNFKDENISVECRTRVLKKLRENLRKYLEKESV